MTRLLLLSCVLLTATACTHFAVTTPPHFVELRRQYEYDYRATTPDGMVLGLRTIDNDEKGDLGFWSQAVELRIRGMGGYALLERKDLDGPEGLKGTSFQFGHDEGARPHLYRVVLFVTPKRIYLLEAGAAKDTFERYTADVDGWLRSFQPK